MNRHRGSATVEFALVLPLLLLVVLAIVEVAVVARQQLEIVHAAREGARTAATTPDPAEAVAAVRRQLGPETAPARVSVIRPHVVGRAAVVSVAMPHRVATPVFGGFTVTLRATARMRVER